MKTKSLKVKAGIKGGKLAANHIRGGVKVRTGLKAGGESLNHSRAML
ncbi:MAG TPA: hypothetical protein VN903_15225 [Polyangia bacterium]|jgi:hypothetical protein|nr:hypothetical protein [Polyangia bacterium]